MVFVAFLLVAALKIGGKKTPNPEASAGEDNSLIFFLNLNIKR